MVFYNFVPSLRSSSTNVDNVISFNLMILKSSLISTGFACNLKTEVYLMQKSSYAWKIREIRNEEIRKERIQEKILINNSKYPGAPAGMPLVASDLNRLFTCTCFFLVS